MAHLIYAHDPLCGWCYGFIPALDALTTMLPGLRIELALGGLVTGDRIGPYSDQRDYLLDASAKMTAVTGQPLGPSFFDRVLGGDVLSTSVPPSQVLLDVMQQAPDKALAVAHAIQRAHFRDGADLNQPGVYAPILATHAPDVTLSDRAQRDPSPALAAEITRTRQELGVSSFPTIIVVDGTSHRVLPTEYRPDAFVQRVRRALA